MAGLIDKIFERSMKGLEKSLDLTWYRNDAITSNIANAETPQYRAVDVDFARELEKAFAQSEQAVAKTHAGHIDTSELQRAHFTPDYSGVTKPDGNNVDIDIQMGKLAHNSGQFTMATNLIRKEISLIRNIIRDAGR